MPANLCFHTTLKGVMSSFADILPRSVHVSVVSFLCSTSLPLFLAHYPSSAQSHLASALTLAGSSTNVQQEPCHQHNGTSMGSTLWDSTSHNITSLGSTLWDTTSDNVSWPVTFIFSSLCLNTLNPTLPTVEQCIIEGEYHLAAMYGISC